MSLSVQISNSPVIEKLKTFIWDSITLISFFSTVFAKIYFASLNVLQDAQGAGPNTYSGELNVIVSYKKWRLEGFNKCQYESGRKYVQLFSTQVCPYGRALYLQSLKVHFCNLIFAKTTKFDEVMYTYLTLRRARFSY